MTDPRIKTARGAHFARQAIVPRVIEELRPEGRILDFGCGPKALHVGRLRDQGLDVWGYDLAFERSCRDDFEGTRPPSPFCFGPGCVHNMEGERFGTVYLSNVVNVQHTVPEFDKTMERVVRFMQDDSQVILNYPSGPRKIGWCRTEMRRRLEEWLGPVVQTLPGPGGAWRFHPATHNWDWSPKA